MTRHPNVLLKCIVNVAIWSLVSLPTIKCASMLYANRPRVIRTCRGAGDLESAQVSLMDFGTIWQPHCLKRSSDSIYAGREF